MTYKEVSALWRQATPEGRVDLMGKYVFKDVRFYPQDHTYLEWIASALGGVHVRVFYHIGAWRINFGYTAPTAHGMDYFDTLCLAALSYVFNGEEC